MKIVDAFTGRNDLGPGSTVRAAPQSPAPFYKILAVRDSFFKAWALIEYPGSGKEPFWQELAVRFTHPQVLLPARRVLSVLNALTRRAT